MVKTEAVSDSGPLIHLSEINQFKALEIFKKVLITPEIQTEINAKEAPGKKEVEKSKLIEIKNLNAKSKDFTRFLCSKYYLHLGESSAIALIRQEDIEFFLTDDLGARLVANHYNIKAHGCLGILTRAFREKKISKKEVIIALQNLKDKSSLFITSNIISMVIKEIEEYKK